jgi:hypothetical protein
MRRKACLRHNLGRSTRSDRFSYLLPLVGALASAAVGAGCASTLADNHARLFAKLSVIPATVDFREVVVGQKNSQTLRISNTSKDSVVLEHLAISGKNFILSGAKVPLSLAPGANVHLTVAFTPSSTDQVAGALEISSSGSDASKDSLSVPLAGSGEKAAPQLSLSPSGLNFGSLSVHSSSSQTVTLKNSGNVALTVGSVSLPNSAFSESGLSSGSSLAPGQALQFQVTFHPASTGVASSGLSVSSSGLSAPATLALSGSGTNSPSNAAPTAPAAAPSSHSVSLNWDASASSVVGYHVYRSSLSGGPYARISGSTVSALNYNDPTVQSGTRYFYVVSALDSSGTESAYSHEAAADVPNN